MDILNNKYEHYIHERYTDLIKSKKPELDNNDLWKIFEYYSCLELSKIYKKAFYEYDDIDPDFKEKNKMSRNDTGIDLSDLDKTIVQCKLRKNALTWKECSTFFGSQNIFDKELNKAIVRWEHLIIARNSDSVLSENLLERKELFIDMPFDNKELIKFCENLILNPPKLINPNTDFLLRDYQQESINMIKNNKKNVMINLPTGTGKNSVIIYSFEENKKYLILVPRIILMEQLKEEIIKHKPKLKSKIQLIGDANNEFKDNKLITICVFNSVKVIEEYADKFEKIYIDEAHHINKPEIYYSDDDLNEDKAVINNEKNDEKNNESDSDISDDEFNSDISDDESNSDVSDDEVNSDISDDEVNSDISDDEYEAEELIDDPEDELKNVNTYTQIIKSLVKHNNNVYLSATIDKTDNFEYYSKDIRNMIELGYLCDYTIHIPIFSEDPDNNKTCEYLLKNYKNIIIYCNSQKEGKEINRIMNMKQKNSSEYVDCNTPKKKRNEIINRYKTGDIPFLVNVRILVEGFDAPTTKGVVFLHLPRNKTTLIQIIGRALRLHPTKTIANIILPFSSKEDEKNIGNFLKIMAQNDGRIRKSFENKTIGGYVSIDRVEDTEDDEVNNKIEFKYNMVYDSMGELLNGEEVWMARLEEVKKYIDENNKRPNQIDKDKKISALGNWLSDQIYNYKHKKGLLKNIEIWLCFNKFLNDDIYKQNFVSNKEIWYHKLETLKKYMNENNKRPHPKDPENKETRSLGQWLNDQIQNYKHKKTSMKEIEIYNKWTEFMNDDKYKIHFVSPKNAWQNNLAVLKKYINENNKKPDESNNIHCWMRHQIHDYKYKKGLMNEIDIYNEWAEFINDDKYRIEFIPQKDMWDHNFALLKKYIDENNKKPTLTNKNISIKKLGKWFSRQLENYKFKKHSMIEIDIYNKWTEFINSKLYSKYFMSQEDEWRDNLNILKKYIDENNKKPTKNEKNIYWWMKNQIEYYKYKKGLMDKIDLYNKWTEFINDNKYEEYFVSSKDTWNYNFDILKIYIDENNKKPATDNNSMRCWFRHQINDYKYKKGFMKETKIYNTWTRFINDPQYSIYFVSREDVWCYTLNALKKYIDENNKKPTNSKNNIYSWMCHQIHDYKYKKGILKNPQYQHMWYNFITDPQYKQHFDQNIAKPNPILTNPIKTETNDPDKNTSPTTAIEPSEKIIVKTPRKKKTPKD
jgi:superfamily II DNA/RNA helicase